MTPMASVNVRELRQNLSAYLRRVERGERLTITRRGREVAVLAPLDKKHALVEHMIDKYGGRPPSRAISECDPPLRLPRGRRPPGELLEELREERLSIPPVNQPRGFTPPPR